MSLWNCFCNSRLWLRSNVVYNCIFSTCEVALKIEPKLKVCFIETRYSYSLYLHSGSMKKSTSNSLKKSTSNSLLTFWVYTHLIRRLKVSHPHCYRTIKVTSAGGYQSFLVASRILCKSMAE